MGILFKLLGIGRAIISWFLGIIHGLFKWCSKHPLLALAIAIDLVLVAGCWWGYGQHSDSQAKSVQIVQLHKDIKEKDSLIELLYKRIKEYGAALTEAQDGRVADIEQHNKAVRDIQRVADEQIAKARLEAERTKRQRDAYFKLSEKYRRAGPNCGTPDKRIACEERINREFIRDMQAIR